MIFELEGVQNLTYVLYGLIVQSACLTGIPSVVVSINLG